MLRLIWEPEASDDLEQIIGYIGRRNIDASKRMRALVIHSAELIPNYPYMHRQGRVAGTREAVVHPNYILVYRVDIDAVRVIAVFHVRQRYP